MCDDRDVNGRPRRACRVARRRGPARRAPGGRSSRRSPTAANRRRAPGAPGTRRFQTTTRRGRRGPWPPGLDHQPELGRPVPAVDEHHHPHRRQHPVLVGCGRRGRYRWPNCDSSGPYGILTRVVTAAIRSSPGSLCGRGDLSDSTASVRTPIAPRATAAASTSATPPGQAHRVGSECRRSSTSPGSIPPRGRRRSRRRRPLERHRLRGACVADSCRTTATPPHRLRRPRSPGRRACPPVPRPRGRGGADSASRRWPRSDVHLRIPFSARRPHPAGDAPCALPRHDAVDAGLGGQLDGSARNDPTWAAPAPG